MAQDVLELPAEVVAFLEAYQATGQFTGYAADLVSVALWGGAEQSVVSLAARTLASEDDVRGALQYAEDRGLLRIDRQPEDRFFLVPLGRDVVGRFSVGETRRRLS